MALIFALSQQSSLPTPGGLPLPDKAWHALFYAVLGALLWRAAGPGPRGGLIALVIGAVYGYTDEVHQRFVPGRTYDLGDWAFDLIGLAAGVLLCAAAARCRRRRL